MSTVSRTRAKTFFEWIRPSMIADGLIVPASWQEEHTARAEAYFTDDNLCKTAVILTALHPHVVDYIAQAPVLVLAAFGEKRYDLTSRASRLDLAARFIAAAGPCHRLPHIMRAYGLAPPLRKLVGERLGVQHHRLLAPLAAVPDTALAQAIPGTSAEQRAWLFWLVRLADRGWSRHVGRDRFLTWAIASMCTPAARQAAGEIADWAMLAAGAFSSEMSFEEARAASNRWHEEQAAARRRSLFAYPAAERARIIDYAPLPTMVEVDDLTFNALATVDSLELESERMRHCVRSYWHYVASGRSRIYSIRQGERHIATMELRRAGALGSSKAFYQIVQLKGYRNARPVPAIFAAAERCVAVANERCEEDRRARMAAARAAAAEAHASATSGRRRRKPETAS